jgi:hypothetical protein
VTCHQSGGGGIGPFGLTSYAEVQPLSALIADSTQTNRMPPWPPATDSCVPIAHERTLDATQKAIFKSWADDGAPEGNPADYVAPPAEDRVEMGEPDLVVDIGTDYKPTPPRAGSIDDYHCFVIDPGLTEDKWINAYETVPSNFGIAHHMLMYSVPPSQLSELESMSGQEPGPGYTCFGGPRVGNANLLGGWVPGTVMTQYQEGAGVRIEAGSLIVVQMHYNTINDAEGTDRTEIKFHFTDGPGNPSLRLFPIAQPGLFVPAGEKNGYAEASTTLPFPVTVHGIAPHMHTLGTATRTRIESDDTDLSCLIDIPNWDFNWQGFYVFDQPVTLPSGTSVTVECEYDNSPDNQQGDQMPRDVRWGEGTFDEMCITYFIVEG